MIIQPVNILLSNGCKRWLWSPWICLNKFNRDVHCMWRILSYCMLWSPVICASYSKCSQASCDSAKALMRSGNANAKIQSQFITILFVYAAFFQKCFLKKSSLLFTAIGFMLTCVGNLLLSSRHLQCEWFLQGWSAQWFKPGINQWFKPLQNTTLTVTYICISCTEVPPFQGFLIPYICICTN